MIVGRVNEIALLEKAYKSNQSEFIAIYGRRRIGKTFLVRESLGGRFTFTYSGMPNTSAKMQLQSFHTSLMEQGHEKCPIPVNWIEAFHQLSTFLNITMITANGLTENEYSDAVQSSITKDELFD